MDGAPTQALRGRLGPPLAMLGGVVLLGTAGYFLMWLDALYMTIITITTVGYGEIRPLGPGGRVFTMIVAVTGVATLFYTATVVMEYIVTVRLADPAGRRRRMERDIARLERHVIVTGVGRVGRQACEELAARARHDGAAR